MSTSIDPTSYIAVVRTAVWDTELPNVKNSDESSDLIELLATIGQDISSAPSKTRRYMAWAFVFGVHPWGRTLNTLAEHIGATLEELELEIKDVREVCLHRDPPGPTALELLRQITNDILSKRSKVQRLLNWMFVLRSAGPEFPTLQSIGHYCGVTRQAAHKDIMQIYKSFPYLRRGYDTLHAQTNRRNTKLQDPNTNT